MFKSIFKLQVIDGSEKKKLVQAPPDKVFRVHQGPNLSNLQDLLRSFSVMEESQFCHHVYRGHNDFSLWVEEILLDKHCARKLRHTHTPAEAMKVVEESLKEYA